MLFNSLQYMIFLPVVLAVYYIIPDKMKHIWLLICSYFFYMCWNAVYALLILFSTAATYLCALLLERARKSTGNKDRRLEKLSLGLCLILNLGILFHFKYFNFAVASINSVFARCGFAFSCPTFDIVLPVGISFYTFQALGYTIDVYRGDIYAEKSFLRYALFVSFFPQLVAGPIERSKNLLKQLAVPKKADFNAMREGVLLILWGFFLKVVLSDRIAIFVDTVYGDSATYGGWYTITATLLFAVQIYCDFGGYSTIAVGSAKMLGVELMENFNTPYLSMSTAEFWRRWHVSLSTWFRDYVYIPLGGNRKGKARKYLNIMITFGLSGLWHGAQWTYVFWGLLNGAYQVIGDMLRPLRDWGVKTFGLHRDSLGHKAVKMLVTFVLINFTWVFFRAPYLSAAFDMVRGMFTIANPWILFDGSLYWCGLDQPNFNLMLLGIALLAGADICKYRGIKLRELIVKQDAWCQSLVIALSVSLILLFGIYGGSSGAANFIYFQF